MLCAIDIELVLDGRKGEIYKGDINEREIYTKVTLSLSLSTITTTTTTTNLHHNKQVRSVSVQVLHFWEWSFI